MDRFGLVEKPLAKVELADGSIFNYYVSYKEASPVNLDYKLIQRSVENHSDLTVHMKNLPHHLSSVDKITVLDSVNSGTGRDQRDVYAKVIKPLFETLNIHHEYIPTASKLTIADFSKALDLSIRNTIIMLSGDTSVAELINNFPIKKSDSVKQINLILVAMGSGNALATSSDNSDVIRGVQSIFSTSQFELPIYRAKFPENTDIFGLNSSHHTPIDSLLFTVVVSWGSHAELVTRAENPALRACGVDRFKVAAGEILQQDNRYKGRITIIKNGEAIPINNYDAHGYVLVSAVPNIEKTYKISPESSIKKQELHILDLEGCDNEELQQFMMAPYAPHPQHVHLNNVTYKAVLPGSEIRLEFNEDRDRAALVVDGLLLSVEKPKEKSVIIDFPTKEELGFQILLSS